MINETNALFTIGQFAELHEINKKTLMWYDEIGLLKPACIKENGYRCYSYAQSSSLETILMLRELNVSIKEIQEFMEHRSAAHLEVLLSEKITELNQTISHLKKIQTSLKSRCQEMHILLHMDLSQISLIQRPSRYLVFVPTSSNLTLEEEITNVVKETKRRQLHRLHDAAYGSATPVEYLMEEKFLDYTALFIEIPSPAHKKGLHIQPAGTYLRAFCKGSWDRLPDCYQRILDYASRHHLTLYGYAYEKGINEVIIDTFDDYITQIEIPVKQENE